MIPHPYRITETVRRIAIRLSEPETPKPFFDPREASVLPPDPPPPARLLASTRSEANALFDQRSERSSFLGKLFAAGDLEQGFDLFVVDMLFEDPWLLSWLPEDAKQRAMLLVQQRIARERDK
jgi:hypothetical protein